MWFMFCSTHHQIEHTYTGPVDDELGDSMLACDQEVGLEEGGGEGMHTLYMYLEHLVLLVAHQKL